jgi:hypothetical protein
MTWKRRGEQKVIIAPDGGDAWAPAKPRPDETLIRALARAHRWNRMLEAGRCRSRSAAGSRRSSRTDTTTTLCTAERYREVHCPESAAARPNAAVLRWYNEKRYLG